MAICYIQLINTMKILAIETSCDETALALLEASGDSTSPAFTIHNTALHSQIEIHKEYGGVFPAMAKRAHAKNIIPLLEEVLKDEVTEQNNPADTDWTVIETILEREPEVFELLKKYSTTHTRPNIDLLAVTVGPGLEPALWVGINTARALSVLWNVPLIPVNHMEGHIASVLLEQQVTAFPVLALLISGGHTELILINEWGTYKKIGQTVDDAVGEAYDKVARMIGLPYPGGPEISKLATTARESSKEIPEEISLPRPMLHSKDYNFSFSGLKTAVLYLIQKLEKEHSEISEIQKQFIALEFENAVTDVLIKKTTNAITEFGIQSVVVGGGVIANQHIREKLTDTATKEDVKIFFPQQELSTDNAVMIAMAAYLGQFSDEVTVNPKIIAKGNLSLDAKK